MNKLFILLLSAFLFFGCETPRTQKNEEVFSVQENPVFSELTDFDVTSENAKQELNNWIKEGENGFLKKIQVGDFNYSALWIPAEYNLLQNYENVHTMKEAEVQELLADYQSQQVVQLQIKNESFQKELLKYNLESPQQYSERLKYVTTDIVHDVVLVCGSDSLKCVNAVYERGYDVNGIIRVQLVFPRCLMDEERDVQLIFDDQLFNAGPMRMRFGKNNINV